MTVNRMEIAVKLKLDNPYDIAIEEIEKDIRMGENEIGWKYCYKIESVDKCIEVQPTVDAVNVVQCKDCIHACDYTDIYPKSEGYKCIRNGNFHDENWFCADGDRKGGEQK